MPLLYIKDIPQYAKVGLWQMQEQTASYVSLYGKALESFKSETRKLEYICVRLLLCEMVGRQMKIVHNTDGRPILTDGGNISISHTKGYCAVIISENHNVAIDIEYMSDRVNRIVSEFMRADEKAYDTTSKLLHWSAKETMYKLYSEDHLAFEDIKVLPFKTNENGIFQTENLRNGDVVDIHYNVTPDYVMTYAYK